MNVTSRKGIFVFDTSGERGLVLSIEEDGPQLIILGIPEFRNHKPKKLHYHPKARQPSTVFADCFLFSLIPVFSLIVKKKKNFLYRFSGLEFA